MKVRFQADHDLHRAIVRGVLRRLPTADFQSQSLKAVDDLTVLRMAAEAGRIVVSHDVSTMPQAFAELRRTSHSPGVLLTPQSWAIAEAIEQLALIWELTEASEWRDRICYLPAFANFRCITAVRNIFFKRQTNHLAPKPPNPVAFPSTPIF